MYTVEDFKNGLVIIDNKTSRNPAKVREILNFAFGSTQNATGNSNYYHNIEAKINGWVGKSNVNSCPSLPVQNVNDFQIPTQSCVQKLNIGDTYTFIGDYRIISDFKDKMFHVSNRHGVVTGKFGTEELLECFNKNPNFKNYQSILLTNNKNNQNEKTGKTSTVGTGKRTESSISSSITRQIASASRLVGNPTHGTCKETRVGRIEISSNAISF